MKELVALILAGGTGTRFSPFSRDKLLFPFMGKPLVSFTPVFSLPKTVNRVVVVSNDKNKEWFIDANFGVPHTVIVQNESNGMADAVLTAEKEIGNARLLICIADDLFDAALLSTVVETGQKENVFGVLPGWKTKTYFPGGYLVQDGKRVSGIVEKPGEGKEPSEYVNISGHYISDSDVLLNALKTTKRDTDDVYEEALTGLMQEYEFSMVPYTGRFQSLKYPWHVLPIMDTLLSGIAEFRGENVIIKDHVVLEGQIHIGNNVKIMEFTKIVGPVYIGDNTIVGNNNCIRHSMIGANCITGFNTDITRSYIGDSCWFHSNYIGDSILEENVSMGSGSVLANLRLDEGEISSIVKEKKVGTGRTKLGAMIGNNVRIGVNASIMPGIKIGSRSFVGAGVTLAADLGSDSFCKNKPQLEIAKNSKQLNPTARDQFKTKL
jgi:UDP-N-acetylglucosamine diphosphorylase / glucose-1-phosphate thymidylyltransferase / UDP-N-acetylgalactosamine diphosphorylase / glucosamine-1-phosphate N-acetyltransferase / galactosamine-1-phosphate N-acetyltransferase